MADVRKTPAAAKPEFADLEDLLTESLAEAKVRDATKAEKEQADRARARIVKGMPQPDDAALLKQWAEKHEWRHAALAAFFIESTCKCCGRTARVLEGVFVRQINVMLSHSQRWIDSSEAERERNQWMNELPREVIIRRRPTECCYECAASRAWPMAAAQSWRI